MPDTPFPDTKMLKVEKNDFTAAIPAGIKTREALFAALKETLHFPEYFGHNWGALSECLRDLSWIPQKKVILFHQDILALPRKDMEEYSDILHTAMRYWQEKKAHKLIVGFP